MYFDHFPQVLLNSPYLHTNPTPLSLKQTKTQSQTRQNQKTNPTKPESLHKPIQTWSPFCIGQRLLSMNPEMPSVTPLGKTDLPTVFITIIQAEPIWGLLHGFRFSYV